VLHFRNVAGELLSRLRSFAEVPLEVRGSVTEAERQTERFATSVRLGIVILIGLVFAVLALITGHIVPYVAVIYCINLALSFVSALILNPRIYRRWLAWVLTTFDVVIFLAIIELGPVGRSLPGNYTPALSGVWALFILFALVSLRGSAIMMIYATALATVGLGMHLFAQPTTVSSADAIPDFSTLFEPERNSVRLALLASTGIILAISALRAKQTLSRAAALARERANLSKYLPSPMVELLAERDVTELRRGRLQPATILFADIRGFTAMSERLSPMEVAALLNSFRDRVARTIEREGGIVDKFIGDGVMGVFGLPEPEATDARAALLAARELVALVKRWNAERLHEGLQSIRIGIGVHYGKVFAGVLGYEGRLEFTVIGDVVNVAQRVEALTKEIDIDLLVTEDVLQAAVELNGPVWQFVRRQPLRGRSAVVGLFTANA
jgi:adenylate cyclase